MSRIWMCGFEQDSTEVFDYLETTPFISSVAPRSGTYHLRTPNDGWRRGRVDLTPLRAEIFVRVYAKTVTNTPAAASVWFLLVDGNGVNLLSITETGQVWLGSVTVGVDKGNAGPLTTSYAMWEIRLLVDNAAGLLDVRVDGVSVVSDSGIDTREGAVDTVGFMWLGNVSADVQDSKDFDDVAVNNTLSSFNNSWCGKGAILGCVSIDDGAANDLSRFPDTGEANWEDVDERPPDDDTTYVFATAVEQSEYYDVTSMESTHGVTRATQVRAVAWWVYNRLVYNGDGQIAALHRQSGFTQQMPPVDCPQLVYAYSDITVREENSITSAQFTAGDIDDSEFGFRSKAP